MTTQSSKHATEEAGFPIPLWINADMYIPINPRTGQCAGLCAEGALGFIVQLCSINDPEQHYALKIPRLMGETHRENAYICQLLEQERIAVQKVHGGRNANPIGLLNAQVLLDCLRGPIDTARSSDETARAWDNAIILVRFEKSSNPYFCLLLKTDNGIKTLPDTIAMPLDRDRFHELATLAVEPKDNKPWARTVFLDFGEPSSKVSASLQKSTIFPIDVAFKEDRIGNTWYAGVPSVVYGWAPGTLQEAISLGTRGYWNIHQHLQFAERVCRGVNQLHSKHMLHGDLRPANIVYQSQDATEPENYSLTDYGSFADTTARPAARGNGPSGETVLGPIVGGERTSAFYAPERRSGQERESADTAVIIKTAGDRVFVVLGWKSDLIDEATNFPKDNLLEMVKPEFLRTHRRENETKFLQAGDRIQIREYIFELREAETVYNNRQIFECDERFYKIYHGRIVVESSDAFAQPMQAFPIPRTIELQKWSAGTDLYSLGVLALYSVYRNGQANSSINNVKDGDKENSTGSSTDEGSETNNHQVEDDFREMLVYLASPPYFNVIWLELDWLRHLLEHYLDTSAKLTGDDFAKIPVERWNEAFPSEGHEPKGTRTLRAMVVETTRLITQTVPGTRLLVEAVGYDLGAFIFFIHFAMCCLHRSTHMESDTLANLEKWSGLKPFCDSRLDEPDINGPAQRALNRLVKIMGSDRIGNLLLRTLQSGETEIPKYNPKPDAELRVLIQQLEEKERQLNDDIQRMKKENNFMKEKQHALNLKVKEAFDAAQTMWVSRRVGPVKQIVDILSRILKENDENIDL